MKKGKESWYRDVMIEDLMQYESMDEAKLRFNEKLRKRGAALMVAMQIMLDGIGLPGVGEKINSAFALFVAGFRAPKVKVSLVPQAGFRSPDTDRVPNIEVICGRLLQSVEEIKRELPDSLSTSEVKREYGMAWIRNEKMKEVEQEDVDVMRNEKDGRTKACMEEHEKKLRGKGSKYYPLYGISEKEASDIRKEDFILPEELVTTATVKAAKETMEEMFCNGKIDCLERSEMNTRNATIEQYLYRVNNVDGRKYAGHGPDEKGKCVEIGEKDEIIGHVLAVHNFGSEEFRKEVISAVNELPFLASSGKIGQRNMRYYRYSSISKGAFFAFGNEDRVLVSDSMKEVEEKLHKLGWQDWMREIRSSASA